MIWSHMGREAATSRVSFRELLRGLALVTALVSAASAYPVVSIDTPIVSDSNWPGADNPLARAWQPFAGQITQQNPPDFSWPAVPGATGYDLEVYTAENATTAVQARSNLRRNFFNFPEIFPAGAYRWRARWHRTGAEGLWSEWREFYISPGAFKFPVPSAEALMAKVPAGHPRIWTTADTLQEFRERARGPRKAWFEKLLRRVRLDMAKPLPKEPTFAFAAGHPRTADWLDAQLKLRAAGWDGPDGAALRVMRTALAYLVTGEKEIGRNAVEQMLNIATWDPHGATSYETHDQVHRALAWQSAVAYDWCYELMTPEERSRVLAMVEARTKMIVDHVVVTNPVNEEPYNSHAWTVFGHVGIIAIATLNELPEAREWFEGVWPAYINTLAPWGGEDGGWAQGPNYWQYSQASIRGVADTLLAATGFSLYDKAYFHNHAYFPLYVFPHGTPRSYFGDGNEYTPGLYNKGHFARLSQIYRDPVLKWAGDVIGGKNFVDALDETKDGEFSAYYSGEEDMPSQPPTKLPRARWFSDIGWVAMHSDLVDPERISLYFKSSPYGSHSHSHADQNSFVINAFGEALAIDAGYYDAYGTPHDVGFTRQTKAHNAITHDGGYGQPIYNVQAKGKITSFLTHPRVDVTSGDATAAYRGDVKSGELEEWLMEIKRKQSRPTALGRAVRHVIYLRPEVFVVVDDLGAPPGSESTFEWWLQSLREPEIDGDQRGALVHQGKANLKVRFAYPANVRATLESEFIGPPNAYALGAPQIPIPPFPQSYGGDPSSDNQFRICFQTPRTAATRIVTVLQPYRNGSEPMNYASHVSEDAVDLRFANGDRVVINLNPNRPVQADGVRFDGVAAASVRGTWLLHQGRHLHADAWGTIKATDAASVAVGDGEVRVYSNEETAVEVRAPGFGIVAEPKGAAQILSSDANALKFLNPVGAHSYRYQP